MGDSVCVPNFGVVFVPLVCLKGDLPLSCGRDFDLLNVRQCFPVVVCCVDDGVYGEDPGL